MTITALSMYRTCAEVLCAGHERNGFYLLDSDGPNTGDPPYTAYCDLENNGTVFFFLIIVLCNDVTTFTYSMYRFVKDHYWILLFVW